MKKDKLYLPIIGVLSVIVPVLVAVLLFMEEPFKVTTYDVSFLPHLNAILNSATAVSLVLGFVFIKRYKNECLHKTAMMVAFVLSSLFLISYVIYHSQAEHTTFDGEGAVRTIYLFILGSHIILSIAIVPLVLLSIYFAITNRITKHKRLVKFTFPIWIYVAITGVVVYMMIRQYY